MICGKSSLFYVGRKAGHFVLASRFNRDTTSIFLKLARIRFSFLLHMNVVFRFPIFFSLFWFYSYIFHSVFYSCFRYTILLYFPGIVALCSFPPGRHQVTLIRFREASIQKTMVMWYMNNLAPVVRARISPMSVWTVFQLSFPQAFLIKTMKEH